MHWAEHDFNIPVTILEVLNGGTQYRIRWEQQELTREVVVPADKISNKKRQGYDCTGGPFFRRRNQNF